MLAANHQTEHGDPSGGVRGRMNKTMRFATPSEVQQYQQTRPPQSSEELNHQPKNTHGGTMAPAVLVAEDGIIWQQWDLGPKELGPMKV